MYRELISTSLSVRGEPVNTLNNLSINFKPLISSSGWVG